nr:uncharacterized protein LOC111428249 [Onthophagus taurus]
MFRIFRPILIRFAPKSTTKYKSTIAKRVSKRNRSVNPGVNLQRRILSENEAELKRIDLDSIEADFTNLECSHKDFVEETKAIKEQEQYLIVREKYFKEKYPNFLTWSDKLQIRHLYSTDPEEWCVEKLSHGFPALPEVIKKIVKSSWSKTNPNKIKNHDLSVEKNWDLFKEGKLDLPSELKEHLNKFTSRKMNHFELSAEKKPVIKKIDGEFSEILKSYDRLKNKNKENFECNESEKIQLKKTKKLGGNTMLINSGDLENDKIMKKDNKLVTLSELKNRIGKKSEMGNDLSMEDQLLLRENKIELENVKEIGSIVDISELKNTNYLSTQVKSKKDFKHLEYPEKIIIPKDKFKKGYTYKLNDCFYDCDGLFLYRVPGMEK